MEDRAFARHLAAWIDPNALLNCACHYDEDPDEALGPTALAVSSGRLQSGDEAKYAELVRKFLRGFSIPDQLVELVRRFKPEVSDQSWSWLRGIQTSVEVESYSRLTVPRQFPPTTILVVKERNAVLDVVHQPVLALLDLVDQLASHWTEMAALGARIFHEPNMPTEFYGYVDREVASAYLNLVEAPHLSGQRGIKNRYRAVTLYGRAEAADPLWKVSREAALHAAATTRRPG
jgi:hypothetical protein